jgi:hypothetical protein
LLTENKFSKYLLYAIGEIVLVVIGILIALQINNWNENRITNAEELNILKALVVGLQKDKEDLLYNARSIDKSLASAEIIIEALDNNKPYNDSIPDHFGIMMFPVKFVNSTSAFETLKSKGIDLIKNDELRNNIIDVYDSRYNFFIDQENRNIDELYRGLETVFSNRFEESFVADLNAPNYKPQIKPLDFEALKNDKEFLFYIKSFKNRTTILLKFHYAGLIKRVESLTDQLKNEIESKEN